MDGFAAVWAWTCDPAHKWRSWAAHTLMVIGLALVFGILPAIAFYAFREVEQYVVARWVEGKTPDPQDALADLAFPALGLALFAVAFLR